MFSAGRTLKEVKTRISGPIVPINIPLKEDEEIDYDAFERYIDWLAGKGVPVILMTYGSSEYAFLSDHEIYELTRAGASSNAGRAHFVGASKYWPVKEVLKYIEFAGKYGAEAVMVQPDYFTNVYTSEGIVEYYDIICKAAEFPVWAYTITSNGMKPETVRRLANEVPWVVAMKNDGEAMYNYYEYLRAANSNLQVVSGGQMKTMLYGWMLGARAYLCPVTPFIPDIGIKFIECLRKNEYESAALIIEKWEDPIIGLSAKYNWLGIIKAFLRFAGHFPTGKLRLPAVELSPHALCDVRKVYDYYKDSLL
jgi:4-hydroxy-tetrahydrodipicolinate synthase